MKNIIKINELCKIDNNGKLQLHDTCVENYSIIDFTVSAPFNGEEMSLSNVEIRACKADNGFTQFRGKLSLANVLLYENNFGKEVYFSSGVFYENVKVVNAADSLKLSFHSPKERQNIHVDYPEGHIALDIIEFYGEVFISNIAASVIKINPERHMVLQRDDFDKIDWSALSEMQARFWRRRYRSLKFNASPEGIVSVPNKTYEFYDQVMEGLDILRGQGFP